MDFPVQDICRLTPMQNGMLFHSLQSNSFNYFIQNFYIVESDLNIKFLEKTLEELIRRHDSLRSAFVYENLEHPLRIVLKERKSSFLFTDLRTTAGNVDELIADYKSSDSKRGFDLVNDPLLRLTVLQIRENKFAMIWSHHHIIMDGWSTAILIREFEEFYNSLVNKRPAKLSIPGSFTAYAEWIANTNQLTSATYWKNYLQEYKGTGGVSAFKTLPILKYHEPASLIFRLDEYIVDNLRVLAFRLRVSVNTMIRATWGILIAKYNNSNDIVFGTVVSDRPKEIENVESIIGLFINTIPVRVRFQKATTLRELLMGLQSDAFTSEAHQFYPLSDIKKDIFESGALFDHILTFENYPKNDQADKERDSGAFNVETIERMEQNSFDFTFLVFPEEAFTIKINYNSNCFKKETIRKVADQFQEVIKQLNDEECLISGINILTEKDKNLIKQFTIPVTYSDDRSVLDVFNKIVESYPEKIALKDAFREYSYLDLDLLTDRLAFYLINVCQLEPTSRVGILMEASSLIGVAMIGILKANCSFVPIDHHQPKSRQSLIFEDANLGAIITTTNHLFNLEGFTERIVALDIELDHFQNPPAEFTTHRRSSEALYIIYTSGSTGTPKGVIIEDKSVVNYVSWLSYFCKLDSTDSTLLLSSHAFDLGYTSIWGALLNGGTLHIVFDELSINVEAIYKYLVEHRISFIKTTPSFLNMLIYSPSFHYQSLHLRLILTGGEKLKYEDVNLFLKRYPEVQYVNHYGPTETTIGTVAININRENLVSFQHQSLIGTPILNSKVTIVNSDGSHCPIGNFGEICVTGVGVGRGYLNSPELTHERFVSGVDITNEIVYKTGDLGRWLDNGYIEISGRSDNQIKIRGYRVDLKEIDLIIRKLFLFKDIVVMDTRETNKRRNVTAYIKTNEHVQEEGITRTLKDHLPDYMIPEVCVLNEFPLTANGKIDHKRLAQMSNEMLDIKPSRLPSSPTEEKILRIWAEVLGVEKLNVQQDFFEVGGHSLTAVQVISKINRDLDLKLGVEAIFNFPTVELLSAQISDRQNLHEPEIFCIEEQHHYNVSDSQRRMWIAEQFNEDKRQFNIVRGCWIHGELDIELLRQAVKKVIAKHEILRTSIILNELGDPRQLIADESNISVDLVLSDFPPDRDRHEMVQELIQRERERAFFLESLPLFRIRISKDGSEYFIILAIHHIITDYYSSQLMHRELVNTYNCLYNRAYAEKENQINQYKDFSSWHNTMLKSAKIPDFISFWRNKFPNGLIPRIDFKTDFPRPHVQSYEGGANIFQIDSQTTFMLIAIGKQARTTMFVVFLSLVKLLIHKKFHLNKILVGVPASLRSLNELTSQLGLYIDMTVIYTELSDQSSFFQLLSLVKDNVKLSRMNQPLPFDVLVDGLEIKSSRDRNPLIDIGLNFIEKEEEVSVSDLGNAKISYVESDSSSVKADMWFNVNFDGNIIDVRLDYANTLFKDSTIKEFSNQFIQLTETVAINPQIMIAELADKSI